MQILTTATRRPELLRQTLADFGRNLFGGYASHELLLNVDPVGEPGVSQAEVVEVARSFFGDRMQIRCPEEPSLPKAWIWLMSHVTDYYAFVLEDDWRTCRSMDIAAMVQIMDEDPRLAVLRLSRFPTVGDSHVRQWNKLFPWNGVYFQCPDSLIGTCGFSGNPSLMRGDFLRMVVPYLVPWGCTELQIKTHVHPIYGNKDHETRFLQDCFMRAFLPQWNYGVYARPGWGKTVDDTGEDWRKKHGVPKLHGKEHW